LLDKFGFGFFLVGAMGEQLNKFLQVFTFITQNLKLLLYLSIWLFAQMGIGQNCQMQNLIF
jgi:hypothetical protein